MNRTIYATTAQQRRVGCVYNCIDVQMCDVSNDDNHASVEKHLLRFSPQSLPPDLREERARLLGAQVNAGERGSTGKHRVAPSGHVCG